MTVPATETIRGLRPAGLRCGHCTSHGGTELVVSALVLGVVGKAVLGMLPRPVIAWIEGIHSQRVRCVQVHHSSSRLQTLHSFANTFSKNGHHQKSYCRSRRSGMHMGSNYVQWPVPQRKNFVSKEGYFKDWSAGAVQIHGRFANCQQ